MSAFQASDNLLTANWSESLGYRSLIWLRAFFILLRTGAACGPRAMRALAAWRAILGLGLSSSSAMVLRGFWGLYWGFTAG